ncbi:trypsin-like peptidase domain-containing protein [Mameliella sp.]|uniref:trypsin-like peptidase domain-containing protein n=1 Tax=Mameliella sp. TaxID=1924940 RepID=UPI003BAD50F1
MSIARLIAAASILALGSAVQAQDLMLFPPETFGQVVAPRQETLLDAQLEAQVGAYNNEFVSSYGDNSIFVRTGRAVGMLQILTNVGHAPCTAFLVEGNKLVTNHHCVPGILKHPRMVEKGASSIAAVQFHAGFLRDGIEDGVKSFHVNPVPLETSEALDYTVLQVLGDANAEFGALDLSAAVPNDRDPFWVIGHPMGEAQRISREKCQADSPAVAGNRLRHTCDTLPGNSGSPVIDAGSQKVIGLHHAGSRAGKVNFAVPMAEILAQSKVLKAAVPKKEAAEVLALREELARLRARQENLRVSATRQSAIDVDPDIPESAQFPAEYWAKVTKATRVDAHRSIAPLAVSVDGNRFVSRNLTLGLDLETVSILEVGSWVDPEQPGSLKAFGDSVPREVARLSWEKKSGYWEMVQSVALSPDGTRLATGTRDGLVRLWNAENGKLIKPLRGFDGDGSRPPEFPIQSVEFSPDGTLVAATAGQDEAIIWDLRAGHRKHRLKLPGGRMTFATFSRDGGKIVIGSSADSAYVFDVETGRRLLVLSGHNSPVIAASFSADGRKVVTISENGVAIVWNAQTGGLLIEVSFLVTKLATVDISPDGSRVLTAVGFRAMLWDSETGNRVATLAGHEDSVVSATFTPDGARIRTVSEDGTMRVWGSF